MAVKPSVRFRVFEKANFTCVYCGRKPPVVTLEVDHIDPINNKGTDAESNLVCSCRDCNRGKGKKPLCVSAPDAVLANASDAKERLAQMKSIRRYEAKIEKLRSESTMELASIWIEMGHSYDPQYGCNWWENKEDFSFAERMVDKLGLPKCKDLTVKILNYVDKYPDGSFDIFRYWGGACIKTIREMGL